LYILQTLIEQNIHKRKKGVLLFCGLSQSFWYSASWSAMASAGWDRNYGSIHAVSTEHVQPG
jgi:hypothetical protein